MIMLGAQMTGTLKFWKYLFAILVFGTPGFAQTTGDTTVGGGLSIFGPMLETTYQVETDGRVRAVLMGGLSYDTIESDDDGNRYEIDLALSAAALLFDYYPDRTGWRVSGGVFIDMSDLAATARGAPGAAIEVNGETYADGRVEAAAQFANELAPMVTAGYEYDLGDNWRLSGEVGAVYTGGIEAAFTANSDALQNAVDADADFQKNKRDLRDLTVLPYLSVAVSFRF